MVKVKTATSPTLVAGAFSKTFGEFEKLSAAAAVVDTPATAASGLCFALRVAWSGVTVTVTVLKVTLTTVNDALRVYANADTADVDTKIFTIIAEGE